MLPYLIFALFLWLLGKQVSKKAKSTQPQASLTPRLANPHEKNSVTLNQAKPPVVQAVNQKSSSATGETGLKYEYEAQKISRWVMRYTGLIFIATTVYAFAAIYQWRTMKEQARLTEESLLFARQSMIIQTRAYVGVASLTAHLEQQQVTITLENIGKVPASKIKVDISEYRETEKVSKSTSTYFDARNILLFPGSLKMRVVVPLRYTKTEDMTAITNNTVTLTVAGYIQYDDGFGNEQINYFSFEYSPPPNEGWTAKGNYADFMKMAHEWFESKKKNGPK